VIPKEDMGNLAFMICLDLAHPDTVEVEFKRWMDTLDKIQLTLINRLASFERKALLDEMANHVQSYINPGDDIPNPADEEEEETPVPDADGDEDGDDEKDEHKEEKPAVKSADLPKNLGVPILVVANKCDAFRKHFQTAADAEDHFEIMCSWIRWWCIEYGAASFSMQKENQLQARRILSYVEHRVFGTKFDHKPNYVVKLADQMANGFLFVPSGADAQETVTAQNPTRDFETQQFSEYFKKDEKKKKHNEAKPKMQSDENEKFLKTMQFDLKSGDRTQGVRGGGRANANNGVDINDFFQKLLDPSQQAAASGQ